MFKKSVLISIIFLCFTFCMWAGTHDPWDGTKWSITSPDIDQPYGNSYKEIYDLRKGVAIRMNKEHETLATSSAGGVHKQGSARAFFQDAAPATQVDGSAFDSGDLGSLWFDSNSSIDNQFHVLTATTPTWTPVSTEIIAFLLASNRTFAGTLTVTGESTFNNHVNLGAGDDLIGSSTSDIAFNSTKFTVAGATGNTGVGGTLGVTGNTTVGGTLTVTGTSTFNSHINLGAADDLIGSSTSDIIFNTNKFTVAGDSGNTAVGGTLGVTGTSTVAAVTASGLITANNGVTLGAGDDLIGSSTSDITFNTNKFTVAGASGNTVVGGTLDVVGNIDPTTYETTNGGFLDEDNMASDAANKVASQQSIKKYVDDQIAAYIASEVTLSAYTNEDSETNAMLKDHAYLAATDGEVYANAAPSGGGLYLRGYVGGTNDPAGAGDKIQDDGNAANANHACVSFSVAEGEYFELVTDSTNAVTIYWRSRGTLSKPVDNN